MSTPDGREGLFGPAVDANASCQDCSLAGVTPTTGESTSWKPQPRAKPCSTRLRSAAVAVDQRLRADLTPDDIATLDHLTVQSGCRTR